MPCSILKEDRAISHYSEIKTAIKDRNMLVTALVQQGIKREHIKVDEKGMTCHGYDDQKRRAHVVIKKEAGISSYSAETGFEQQADGTFVCYHDGVRTKWHQQLEAEYTRAVTLDQARINGFFVQENSWNKQKTELKIRITQ